MVPITKAAPITMRPAMAKTVIIAGLFCKKDERTAGAADGDSDGGALTSEVVNMKLVLPESFTTTGVESGGNVVGVEDVTVIEEGSEEVAAGELVEEVLLVASLFKVRVGKKRVVAMHKLTIWLMKEWKNSPQAS
jgi:hypothetical protein